MDYQKFINGLPDLYVNWQTDSVKPKSAQFQQVLDQVEGMTTVNVMQLLISLWSVWNPTKYIARSVPI
jgi:hypothetical protein